MIAPANKPAFFAPAFPIAKVATGEPMLVATLDDRVAAKFIELSPGGDRLAVGINEQLGPIAQGAVTLFDATSGERVDRFDSDRGVISAVAISADTVVSGYEDGTVEIRSLGDDTVVAIPAHAGFVEAVSIAADGQVLSAGGGEVRLWSPDGRSTGLPVAVSAEVMSLAMTIDGQMSIARQSEGHMIVDVSGGPLIEASYPEAAGAQLSPHHRYYDQPGPEFRSVQLYDLDSGNLASEIDLTDTQSPRPSGVPPFYSTDGEWILTVLGQSDDETPIAVTEINGSDQFVFSAEDFFLALFGEPPGPGVFYGFRPESGGERLFGLARNDAGLVRAGWFDLRTQELLAGPLDLEFGGRVLPLADGRVAHGGFVARAPIGILPADLDSAPIVVEGTGGLEPFHQDLSTGRFVVGGPGGLAGVVNPDTAEFIRIPNARGTIYAAAFSPDGTTIALSSFEEGLQLFDASTLRPIGVPVDLGLFDSKFAPGVRWTDDSTGVWVAPSHGPIRISADPERWIEIACEITQRELTAEEWATFVSPDSDPIPACEPN
jgi:WD40 repeat protein